MKASHLPYPNDDRLNRALGYSIAFHLLLFAAFAVRTVFYPSEPLILEDTIRVDIVALPDKQTAKLPPPPAPAEPIPSVPVPAPVTPPQAAQPPPTAPAIPKPETPKVNLNKVKQEQASALKRLEALQNLEKMVKSQPSSSTETKAPVTQTQSAPIKGNAESAGTALKGIARIDHQSYLGVIRDSVKRQWNLPKWLATAGLSARVRIHLDAKGFVIKKDMVTSSSNPVFDERLLAAIDSASPFAPPPDTLTNRVNIDGIELDFSPEQR